LEVFAKEGSGKVQVQNRQKLNCRSTRYINGREYSKTFSSLREAITWKNVFHPSIPEKVIETAPVPNPVQQIRTRQNGEDLGYRFSDIWDLYKKLYITSLEKSTAVGRLSKEGFLSPLFNFKMVEITADLLDKFIARHKADVSVMKSGRRYNFNDELKCLKAMLNWYRENYDPFFINPVLKRHKTAGVIRKIEKRDKKMSAEEVLKFFEQLPPFWRDFAETQFYMAGRVGEVAGLQVSSIDFQQRVLTVKYVIAWARTSKHFDYLKDMPKNGEERFVFLNEKLFEILTRRVAHASGGYVFHDNGSPLSYRQIQYQYNHALKKAGLFPKFSSTHIMRHSMGTITRMVTGSMDSAQAVTGHKDIKMAQHYSSMPTDMNKNAVNDVNQFMRNLELSAK